MMQFDSFQEDYDEFQNDNFSIVRNVSYPENNRYNNAYGNYRGGYDRSNNGPPLGFGPIGPPGPRGPSGPFGPPFPMSPIMGWRRGPSGPPGNMFRGPRKDKIIKYLLRCGISREHVVNLPPDLLAMMQPMNCGLCSIQFDTHELSRVHYASKNHLKNQIKWLALVRSEPSAHHSREPLKARELYCELCDVHITSTGHADSHYAGKPHRAIVEGRKNPRNPFLLQPNKQGRLKTLIRREAKFLKKIEPSTAAKKSKANLKVIAPELYCEICKTSMMCSEQMTTHLNGKKHLSKEKQHILRVMKGEVPADDKKDSAKEATGENTAEGDEDMDEDGGEEGGEEGGDGEEDGDEGGGDGGALKGTGTGEAGAADDDWGEGGEDWKPSSEDY